MANALMRRRVLVERTQRWGLGHTYTEQIKGSSHGARNPGSYGVVRAYEVSSKILASLLLRSSARLLSNNQTMQTQKL